MCKLPENFVSRLENMLSEEKLKIVLNSFSIKRGSALRINNLKNSKESVFTILQDRGINYEQVSWNPSAIILKDKKEKLEDLIQEGRIYAQNLSSILVPLILAPKPEEKILDMCAAPGSKATQIADMVNNKGRITCLEVIKPRFYKLRSVVSLLGADCINCRLIDARRFRPDEQYDKILLDVPCSCEGRFNLSDKKTYFYWSPRKIKEMRRKQKGLILNASRLLKSGGTMVYSTCTFAPEENEEVIDWFLRKTGATFEVLPIKLNKTIKMYEPILKWKEKAFKNQIKSCVRILPDERMEGFFLARLGKN